MNFAFWGLSVLLERIGISWVDSLGFSVGVVVVVVDAVVGLVVTVDFVAALVVIVDLLVGLVGIVDSVVGSISWRSIPLNQYKTLWKPVRSKCEGYELSKLTKHGVSTRW